ncbi:Ig-like domain-containing protein [Microvirga sp. 2MCAF35]|uniref:Ig-like domain-containing protein n=1 Tax=Microvirga sp. 2MCAF35 TaxID=3232987 RepID=UPI003F97F227
MTSEVIDFASDNLIIDSGSVYGMDNAAIGGQAADVPSLELAIAAPRKEIVFIEDDVADIGTLLSGIGRDKEVILLDSTQDGLHQIAQALVGRSGIDALHIISHGEAGAAHLGSLILGSANLDAYRDDLQGIRQGMSADGDILLYGCNIGADSGVDFVQQLAIATGADVAASNDLTGSAALGGDWNLEVVSGQVETAAVVHAQTAALYQNVLNFAPGTYSFGNTANFISGLNVSDPQKAAVSTDVVYRLNGDFNYQLKIDGASNGVFAYTDQPAGQIFAGLPTPESALTISFVDGQLFTPGAIAIANYNNYTFAPENLIIRGYDASGHLVGSSVNQYLIYDYLATSINLSNLGGTPIKTLKITAADGALDYIMIDSISISSIAPPPPVVTQVTSPNTNKTYKIGDTIDIQLNFNDAVDVTGTPQVTLETGATDRVINYLSGSGTSTLTFRYTVQAGDTSADLDLQSIAIALNGGAIKAHGNPSVDASLTLPSPGSLSSLLVNKDIAVDGVAPTLTITSNKSVLKVGDTATLTFTFSEDPGASFTWNGSSGDVSVSGGTLSAISGSGTVRTATFTPTANINNGTVSISVNAGSFADAAGNINTVVSNGPAISYDTKAPTVSVSSSQPVLKVGESSVITFTFSEDPGASFDASDVIFSGGTLGPISGSGLTRTAVFTPTANINNGTATIGVRSDAYQDTVGNGNPAASTSLTYDTKAPTLTIASDKPSLKIGETATITFSFSEDPGSSFSWDGSSGGIAVVGGTLSAISGTGTTRTATFTPTADTEGGMASISVQGSNYQDAKLNTGSNASLSFGFDTLAPATPGTPTLANGNDTGTSNSDGLTNTNPLTIEGTAENGVTVRLYDGANEIASVTAIGGKYSFSLNGLNEGPHTFVAVAVDATGNMSAASEGQLVIVDRTPPTTTITSDRSSLKAGETATITFTFSEDPGNTFTWDGSSGDIAVSGGTLSAISGSGTVRTATFTPDANINNGTASITVAAGSYADAAGNLGGAGVTPSLTFDTAAPTATPVSVVFSADTGASATDLVTKTAAQTISGTLSADLQAGDTVFVSLNNGATWTAAQADGARTWTLAGQTLTGSDTLIVKVTDLGGNDSVVLSRSYALDSVPPTVAIALSSTHLAAGQSAVVTFTFSEAPVGFSVADVTVQNATLSNLAVSGTDPRVYTATLTPNGNQASSHNLITVGTGWSAAAGNVPVAGTASLPYSIDPRQTDGLTVVETPVTYPDGSPGRTLTIPVVTPGRSDTDGTPGLADIPLVTSGGQTILLAQLPVGYGLQVSGPSAPKTAGTSLADLIREIQAHTQAGSTDQGQLAGGGSGFLGLLPGDTPMIVQTITPTMLPGSPAAPGQPLVISGIPTTPGIPQTALVIDSSGLPPGTHLQLDNVDFAAVIGSVTLTGGAGSQMVYADSARQHIVLGADDDTLHGGGGDDYVGSHGGNDWLYGDAGNDTVSGGEGNDWLFGGSGHDRLEGGEGRDRLYGDDGNDRLYGNTGHDTMLGGAGNDSLWGGTGNDQLSGDAGNDTLKGEAGNDRITGGLGRDKMWGGSGKDVFVFTSFKDSKVGAQRDVIYDFQSGHDRIDLRGIDANTHLKGNQAFTWTSQDAPFLFWHESGAFLQAGFTGKAGQLRYDHGVLMGDVNGDGRADFEIKIAGKFAYSDVIL